MGGCAYPSKEQEEEGSLRCWQHAARHPVISFAVIGIVFVLYGFDGR